VIGLRALARLCPNHLSQAFLPIEILILFVDVPKEGDVWMTSLFRLGCSIQVSPHELDATMWKAFVEQRCLRAYRLKYSL
jgi:hypothetical protein